MEPTTKPEAGRVGRPTRVRIPDGPGPRMPDSLATALFVAAITIVAAAVIGFVFFGPFTD